MSFKLTVQAFEARVGNPLRELILIKLADQANDEGVCWPSYETIAHHCEITRRSVINHIKQLEKDGFLRIERVYDENRGQNKSNRYHLTIEQGDIKKEGSENGSPGVVNDLHQGGENGSPEPIKEPINKEPINEPISKDTEIDTGSNVKKRGKINNNARVMQMKAGCTWQRSKTCTAKRLWDML